MRAGFSELQFAYGCTREIEERVYFFDPSSVPYFPSLVEEASKGFDVKIPTLAAPIFLQYKIADYMIRSQAEQWKLFDSPYFRFSVYPANRSPQHNLLKDLSQKEPLVFYCAPAFNEYSEYVLLHQKRLIVSHSVFIPIQELPRNVGSDKHSIVFQIKPLKGYWCSEQKEVHLIAGWESLLSIIVQFQPKMDSRDEICVRILDHIEIVLRENEILSGKISRPDNEASSWQLISDLLSYYFDAKIALISYEKFDPFQIGD
jgi:hypothetical protein